MAYVITGNTFKPFTFDEILKPVQIYEQAYKEQEALLDNTTKESTFSESNLDRNLDSGAYTLYNNATTNLQSVADELAVNGLSKELISKIKKTARGYKETMSSLTDAQKRLDAERERRSKLGPDYVYKADNLRIGDFMNGNTPNSGLESLSSITQDIAYQFTTRAKEITEDSWDKLLAKNGKVINGYFDVSTKSGLTSAQLDTILSDNDTWNTWMENTNISREQKNLLQGFRDSIISKEKAIGYDEYSPSNQLKISDAIRKGATAGLGSTTHNYQRDVDYNPSLAFQWTQYNDTKKQKVQELQLKYPQFQFDEEGNPLKDEKGALKITDGWSQDTKGKWVGPNSQVGTSGGTAQREGYLGVIHIDSDGKEHDYGSDSDFMKSEFNKKDLPSGTPVLPGDNKLLSIRNKSILAARLGFDFGTVNPETGLSAEDVEEMLDYARQKGISIMVSNDKVRAKKNPGLTGQEMIIRFPKTQLSGNNGIEDDQGNQEGDGYNENSLAVD